MESKTDLFIFADSSSVGCAKIWTRECGIRDKVEFEYIDYDMSVYAIPHDLSDSEIKRCYDTAFYLHLGDGDFERIRAIDFASYNRVVVWHAWDSKSLLVLFFICHVCNTDVFHINIGEQPEFINSGMRYLCHADIGFMTENAFYKQIKLVTNEEREKYDKIWQNLYGSDTLPKIAMGYDIICKEQAFVEDILYKHIKKEAINVYGIIGETIASYTKNFCFCPFYLYYILLGLVKAGKAEIVNPKIREGQHLDYYAAATFINGIDVSGKYNFAVRLT
jgi:hypothetical protein